MHLYARLSVVPLRNVTEGADGQISIELSVDPM
jgi:hypothetical protein